MGGDNPRTYVISCRGGSFSLPFVIYLWAITDS